MPTGSAGGRDIPYATDVLADMVTNGPTRTAERWVAVLADLRVKVARWRDFDVLIEYTAAKHADRVS